jgi:hypothetical protein
MTPTFFCFHGFRLARRSVASRISVCSYPGVLDYFGNLDEVFLVLGSVLAADEDLDWDSATFDLVEVFRYSLVSNRRETERVIRARGAFRTFLLRGDDVESVESE